jgi:sulfur carrier protein
MTVTINGQSRTIEAATTMSSLLAALHLPPVRVAVEVNRELVPRQAYGATLLQDGDQVEIVTFVGGG